MFRLLGLILTGVSLVILAQAAVLFAEIVLAVTRRDRSQPDPAAGRVTPSRLVIMVPAHNEAAVIAATLRSLRSQLRPGDRTLVVADNCSDDTGVIANLEGAEVIYRNDEQRRGKGFALDFGIAHLRADAPDIVIVVDADCDVAPGSVAALAARCTVTQRPVQALYRTLAPKDATLRTRLAGFAWVMRNHARAAGLHRIGMPCQLMGTGMAFPWLLISRADLANAHLVEDMKLGLELARTGAAPVFCPEAQVVSYFPASAAGLRSQRTRWEHGHLSVMFAEVPRLVIEALFTRNLPLLAMALDISVPPLALLSLVSVTTWVVACAFYLLARSSVPLVMASASVTLLLLAVILCWHRYARDLVSLRLLLLSPLYVLGKVPLYARFLVARQRDWVRSKRD